MDNGTAVATPHDDPNKSVIRPTLPDTASNPAESNNCRQLNPSSCAPSSVLASIGSPLNTVAYVGASALTNVMSAASKNCWPKPLTTWSAWIWASIDHRYSYCCSALMNGTCRASSAWSGVTDG